MVSKPTKSTDGNDALEKANIRLQQAYYLFRSIVDCAHYVLESGEKGDGRGMVMSMAYVGADLMLDAQAELNERQSKGEA